MSMDEDELDTIRRKKLAELQQYQTQAVAGQQYRDQVQAQRQLILRQILTPEARERLGGVEITGPVVQEKKRNARAPLAERGGGKRKREGATLRRSLQRGMPRRRGRKNG